jgi:hypothetical protein
VSQYSPGWLDLRTIGGPYTRIAPQDFQKIILKGEDHFFDSMEMGWQFYYLVAKKRAQD